MLNFCADSVSPEINTIASHEQPKTIRIGENLVANRLNVSPQTNTTTSRDHFKVIRLGENIYLMVTYKSSKRAASFAKPSPSERASVGKGVISP